MTALAQARLALIAEHTAASRAVEIARGEATGRSERALLGGAVRNHSSAAHILALVLQLIDERTLR